MKITARRILPLFLISIFILGSCLRFIRLRPAGLFYWDQSYYSIEARTTALILTQIPQILSGTPLQKIHDNLRIAKGGIFRTGIGKPSFIFLLSLLFLLFGSHAILIALLSAAAGSGSVVLVYLLCKKLDMEEAGLWASALLAFSPLDIFLSRNGTPTGVASFFFLASFYYLLNKKWFLSGLIAGLAYSCHYGLVANFAALFGSLIVSGFIYYRGDILKEKKFILTSGGRWLVGAALIPIGWEIIYQGIQFVLAKNLPDQFHTYFYFLLRQFHLSGPTAQTSGPQIHFLPKLFNLTHGPGFLFIAAFMTGFYFSKLKSKSIDFEKLFTFNFTLLLMAAWFFNPGVVVARITVFFFPFLCVMMGWFLASLKQPWLKTVVFVLLFFPGVSSIKSILNFKSAYAEASHFVKDQGETQVVEFVNWPPWQFHLGAKQFYNQNTPFREDTIENAVKSKQVRFLALDYEELIHEGTWGPWRDKIRKASVPVKVFSNPMACDELVQFDRIDPTWFKNSPDNCSLFLYDLTAFYGKPPAKT